MCLHENECERHTTLCQLLHNRGNYEPSCFVKIFITTETPSLSGQSEFTCVTNCETKLRALLKGLDAQNIEKLLKEDEEYFFVLGGTIAEAAKRGAKM